MNRREMFKAAIGAAAAVALPLSPLPTDYVFACSTQTPELVGKVQVLLDGRNAQLCCEADVLAGCVRCYDESEEAWRWVAENDAEQLPTVVRYGQVQIMRKA